MNFEISDIDKIQFDRIKISENVIIKSFVNHVKKEYANGDIQIHKFKLSNSEVLKKYSVHNDEKIWKTITNKKLMQQFEKFELNKNYFSKPKDFKVNSSYYIVGLLGGIINYGGAYSPIDEQISDEDSVEMSIKLTKFLMPDRLANYHVYTTFEPWSSFFYNVAWDYSIFIFDNRYTELSCILITDTD